MAARNGSEFLERLSAARVHVEIQGETLTGGVADHPAFRNVVRSYADLYDMQHDPAFRDILTYPSPATGEPVATAFLTPRTPADLVKRRQAFKTWADRSLGMLGRTGDYLNSALMALASAEGWFAAAGPGFGENIRRYYEKVREEDLLCTHTLIPPQANRAVSGSQQAGGALMAHIVREDDNGIVIRGARMLATSGPFADELLVGERADCGEHPRAAHHNAVVVLADDVRHQRSPGLLAAGDRAVSLRRDEGVRAQQVFFADLLVVRRDVARESGIRLAEPVGGRRQRHQRAVQVV